jgi:hypothetical protein
MSEHKAETAAIADVVAAIDDLTRVYLAVQGGFNTRSEAVRRLNAIGIKNSRIARILDMRSTDADSVLAKAARSSQERSKGANRAAE